MAVGGEPSVGHRSGQVGACARDAHAQGAEDLDEKGAGQFLDSAQTAQEGDGAAINGGGAALAWSHNLILRPRRRTSGRHAEFGDVVGPDGDEPASRVFP